MHKLIKKTGNEPLHWEVWQSGRGLTIVSGILGVSSITEEMQLGLLESGKKMMRRLAEEKINQGYEYIYGELQIKVVLQNRRNEAGIEQFRERSYVLQDLLNESLLSTGNGFNDGILIDDDEANIFFYLLDLEIGLNTIMKQLAEQSLLEDVEIAILNEDNSYVSLYPERAL